MTTEKLYPELAVPICISGVVSFVLICFNIYNFTTFVIPYNNLNDNFMYGLEYHSLIKWMYLMGIVSISSLACMTLVIIINCIFFWVSDFDSFSIFDGIYFIVFYGLSIWLVIESAPLYPNVNKCYSSKCKNIAFETCITNNSTDVDLSCWLYSRRTVTSSFTLLYVTFAFTTLSVLFSHQKIINYVRI